MVSCRPEGYQPHAGHLIGANDLLIVGHARSVGAMLVMNDERKFGGIPGLATENRLSEPTE